MSQFHLKTSKKEIKLIYSFCFSVKICSFYCFMLFYWPTFSCQKFTIKTPTKNLSVFFFHPANLHVLFSQCFISASLIQNSPGMQEVRKAKSKLMGTNLHQYVFFLSHHRACGHLKCPEQRSGICKECSLA